MSAISLKSITGITSITTPAGVDNQLTLHTNDTTQRVKVTESGVEIAGDIVLPSSGKYLKIWTGGTQGITLTHGGSFGELDNLTGMMRIKAGTVNLANRFGNYNFINCAGSGSVDLYYDAQNHTTPKLATSATGVTIDGTAVAGGLDISGDIDVDGHTNLDNVSIAGVSTFSGNATFNTGNIIIGTAGKGIDYSAQTVGGIAGVSVTSEILVHYEEGTFTPFISASSSAPTVSYGAERGGKYTRIGDVIFYSLGMNLASYSGGSGNVYIGGFPYVGTGTPGWDGAHVFRDCGAIALNSRINQLGGWMNASPVSGYPILYVQAHNNTNSFDAVTVGASSIQTGRITVHGHYKVG